MKKITLLLLAAFIAVSSFAQNTFPASGSAGIGTTTPNASALLDIESTSQGLLVPQMTLVQRNAIATPATGLMIYQTNSTPGFYYYNGDTWTALKGKAYTAGTGINVSGTIITNTAPNQIVTLDGGGGITISGVYPNYTISNAGSGGSWSLNGNSGTNAATNFIGTTDNQDLVFKVDDDPAGRIDNFYAGTYLGFESGANTFTAFGNSAFGFRALASNISGTSNTAIGASTLSNNTTGSDNTTTGYFSLNANSRGNKNTAIGSTVLPYDSTGSGNTAVGASTLGLNSSGFSNTAVGIYALSNNKTSSNLVAVGDSALYLNSASFNTAVGSKAGLNNGFGQNNSYFGFESGLGNTNGQNNSYFGFKSGYSDNMGSSNTAVGYEALFLIMNGNENVAVGNEALQNTTGNGNTAIGTDSLLSNGIGNYNVAVGASSLFHNLIKGSLVAVGDSALYNNGIGESAPNDAIANVAVGSKALFANTTGRANSALGYQSAFANTTGIHNTSCGYFALRTNTTGSDNTTVGYSADVASAALSNATAIGSGALVSLSNCIVLGNATVTKVGVGVTPSTANIIQFAGTTAKLTTGGVWTNASDKKLKDNFQKQTGKTILDKVNQLDIERWHYIADKEPVTHIGPVAQDFYNLFKVGDDTTISTIDPAGIALLAIQELSAQNDSLKQNNAGMQKQLSDQQSQINELKTTLSNAGTTGMVKVSIDNSDQTTLLGQNIPNPFDHSTLIPFRIPSDCHDASIAIVETATGRIIHLIPVSCTETELSFDAGSLASGDYSYSLYVDGKLVETKQMVLTK
jgi:trimeric autotransporter adhesin